MPSVYVKRHLVQSCCPDTHKHTGPIVVPGPLHWSVIIFQGEPLPLNQPLGACLMRACDRSRRVFIFRY